jgi:hypothetical protein
LVLLLLPLFPLQVIPHMGHLRITTVTKDRILTVVNGITEVRLINSGIMDMVLLRTAADMVDMDIMVRLMVIMVRLTVIMVLLMVIMVLLMVTMVLLITMADTRPKINEASNTSVHKLLNCAFDLLNNRMVWWRSSPKLRISRRI